MIGRIWHGWTRPEDADAYEELLRTEILPGFAGREGFRGAHVLRRVPDEQGDEVEFVTVTWFESPEAVRAFSHDGARGAVIPPAARALLVRSDEHAAHYQAVVRPGEADEPGP